MMADQLPAPHCISSFAPVAQGQFNPGHIAQPHDSGTVFPDNEIAKLLFGGQPSQYTDRQFRTVAIDLAGRQFDIRCSGLSGCR